MKDKNIIKYNDKYSLLGYTSEFNKVTKDFIKDNSKYIEGLKLKKMKQGFLGYEEWLKIEGLNIISVEEIKFRLVKEIIKKLKS